MRAEVDRAICGRLDRLEPSAAVQVERDCLFAYW
jgi:hypothetical protein